MKAPCLNFLAGRDKLGNYGYLSGSIPSYADEPIYVFLWIAGSGYADHEIGEYLGYGTLSINAALTAAPHPVDLNSDGCVVSMTSHFCLYSGSGKTVRNPSRTGAKKLTLTKMDELTPMT